MVGREVDIIQEATNRIHKNEHDEWAQKVVLYDTLKFLEDENFSSGLTVIELMTGVDYSELEQWFHKEELNYKHIEDD